MTYRAFWIVALIFLTTACSGRQSLLMEGQKDTNLDEKTIQAAETLVQEANGLWAKRSDEKSALAAIEKWNEAAKVNPTRADIHRDLAYAYYFMNNVHVRWSKADNKKKVHESNYLKGVDAAERALMTSNPAFAKSIKAG